MPEQLKVLVLGYGQMGHAMEHLLADRCQLYIWEKYPEKNFQSVTLELVAGDADIVLFCLPANPHREVAEKIAPLLKQCCLCVSIAKGLDEAGQTAAQIFHDVFSGKQDYALLYGPMIAEEICSDRYAFAQLGCDTVACYHRIYGLFSETRLYLEHTTDITGITWSVILKNVYAMIFGMADELQLGDNTRGLLTVKALTELGQIVYKMGGRKNSSYRLAGLGDLVTTATSEDSHHHELGRMLVRGELEYIEGEGVHTLAMIMKHRLIEVEHYPLMQLINNIIAKPAHVRESIQQYLINSFPLSP